MKEKRITYHEGADGMLYPNLELPQEQEISMTQIGKYGMMAATVAGFRKRTGDYQRGIDCNSFTEISAEQSTRV